MQIVKTFGQSLYDPKYGTRKAVNKTVVIGNYPTLTNDQLVAIVKEYEKNPEPGMYYFVYDETKRDVVYRKAENYVNNKKKEVNSWMRKTIKNFKIHEVEVTYNVTTTNKV